MQDIASLFFADDEAEQKARALALARALRGDEQLGTLAQLTGDKVLAPFGAGMLNRANQQQEQVAEVGKFRLSKALASREEAARNARELAEAQAAKKAANEEWYERNELTSAQADARARLMASQRDTARDDTLTQQQLMREERLRKEFDDAPIAKAYDTTTAAMDKVRAVAKGKASATDQMAMIYSFMKTQDPGSSVMTGEYATAQNTAGWPDKVRNYFNKTVDGSFLSADQMKDFLETAEKTYSAHREQYARHKKKYRTLAERNKIDPFNVVGEDELEQDAPPADKDAKRKRLDEINRLLKGGTP